jgi:hypothetical protein
MSLGKSRAVFGLAAPLRLTNAAKISCGALVSLLLACSVERSAPSATRGDASVCLFQIESADASGRSRAEVDAGGAASSARMELSPGGTAALTQADFKIPFYPGAIVDTERCQQLRMGVAYSNTVVHTTADSLKVVRTFYRKKLRESANGTAVVETSDGDNVTMVAKRSEKDITMVLVERVPELGIVEITQQQLGETVAR